MIGYLKGHILALEEDRLLLLAGQVGYEVLLPAFTRVTLADAREGDPVALFIHYHQSERQPAPVLIGFPSPLEKDFFLEFISVEAIGPIKAARALASPIHEVAAAIESGDIATLERLKGIGKRTAQKIVATLSGRMTRFLASDAGGGPSAPAPADEVSRQVLDVLVSQLGYKPAEAKDMIASARKRDPEITDPGRLLDAVLAGLARS